MDKETLYHFFERKATSEEKEAIREWLEESPENRDELYRERQFFGAMLLNARPETEDVSTENVLLQKKKTGFRSLFIREFLKVAAVVVLTLGVGFYFLQQRDEMSQDTPLLSVTVPAGQRANLILPDGTSVWLNARTELKYPGTFTGATREVELNGEAYFDVTKNKDNPFIVHTKKCDIEVLGTSFNVEAYGDSEDFFTSLMEGSLRVTDRKKKTNSLLLEPNQLTTFRDGVLIREKITDYDYYRWREGLVCFRNMGFEELIRRFEKCYGIQIRIENKKLAEYAFSGKFRISDGIDSALRVLQRDAPYTFERSEDDSIIYIK